MSERLSLQKIIAPALIVGLGLTACAGDKKEPSAPKVEFTGKDGDFYVETKYTPSGKRITDLGGYTAEVLAYCDGGDLVEMTTPAQSNRNIIERSAQHAACEDGRLEPKDFEIDRE